MRKNRKTLLQTGRRRDRQNKETGTPRAAAPYSRRLGERPVSGFLCMVSLDVEEIPQFYWGKRKSFSMRKTSFCCKMVNGLATALPSAKGGF
ncbi:MAG: hypothetical protein IKR95_01980, partial [Oscillospiraceae bacterium]|nr:hypothetical protein [Oscillospiraceae bacterium]